jgi:hypothetical protein
LRELAAVGLATLVIALTAYSVRADTHTAARGSLADVQAAVNAAMAGDIVRLPAGTATWTS